MIDIDIFDKAAEALQHNLPDGIMTAEATADAAFITILSKRYQCFTETRTYIYSLSVDSDRMNEIYITPVADENLIDFAAVNGINILDCAGNCDIRHVRDGNIIFMLSYKGNKPIEKPVGSPYPVFRGKGLPVIFYFLLDRNNINKPYRNIAEATGVAIGTVKNVIDGLITLNLLKTEGKQRYFLNTGKLLDLWCVGYSTSLKPTLLLQRMNFRDETSRSHWRRIHLPAGMLWGGEPAAALIDNYLTPGNFTLYTERTPATLMKSGEVVPAADGAIAIYKKFWKDDIARETVPPVLIYADLIDSGNSRCIEAAKSIRDNDLKYLF